jgi:DNA-binding response OmpR family regulator
MKTCWARNGSEAARLKESFQPEVVLVDLELPDVSGLSLISWLAGQRDCGIIVVSGRGDEGERVAGIDVGADDYITKPVPMRELVARIRAVHRRSNRPAAIPNPSTSGGQVALGAVRVDKARRTALRQNADGVDEQIHLTTAEFVALDALIEAAPRPVAREKLCRLALRRPFQAEDRGVDQLILNLRRKLFDDDSAHHVIVSVRGAGYAIPTDLHMPAAKSANS